MIFIKIKCDLLLRRDTDNKSTKPLQFMLAKRRILLYFITMGAAPGILHCLVADMFDKLIVDLK